MALHYYASIHRFLKLYSKFAFVLHTLIYLHWRVVLLSDLLQSYLNLSKCPNVLYFATDGHSAVRFLPFFKKKAFSVPEKETV